MTRSRLTLIGLLSLPLLAAVPLPSEAPPAENLARHTPERKTTAAEQDQSRALVPTWVQAGGSPSAAAPSGNPTCNYYCDATSTEWTLATIFQILSAMAVAAFTGGLLFASIRQWRAIKRQGRIAREAMQIAHRPWLIVTDDVVLNNGILPVPPNRPVPVEFDVKNMGRIPALEMRIYMKCSLSKWDDPAPDVRISEYREHKDRTIVNAQIGAS